VNIDGSAAIVVGGASGLGEATVRALHAAGALVTIADVNAEKGEALAAELPGATLTLVEGGHMLPVTQPDLTAQFIREAAARASSTAKADG